MKLGDFHRRHRSVERRTTGAVKTPDGVKRFYTLLTPAARLGFAGGQGTGEVNGVFNHGVVGRARLITQWLFTPATPAAPDWPNASCQPTSRSACCSYERELELAAGSSNRLVGWQLRSLVAQPLEAPRSLRRVEIPNG